MSVDRRKIFPENHPTGFSAIRIKKTAILFLIPTLYILTSCSAEGDYCDNPIPFANLEDLYGCESAFYQMEIDLTEDYTIIRSQTEFEEQVTGSCMPQIDFNKYNLVIGKKWLSNGLITINYKLVNECSKDKLILFVSFKTGIFTVAPNVTYHALVPRLTENEILEVRIIDCPLLASTGVNLQRTEIIYG